MWDVILYNGEADLLECRLAEIGELIERCIIIEGDRTFQGEPRSLSGVADRRFDRWRHKLIVRWVSLRGTYDEADTWERERAHRRVTSHSLVEHGCPPEAMVLHGDVDEIPNRDICSLQVTEPHVLWLRTFAFAVDWEDTPTDGPVLAPRRLYDDAAALRAARRSEPMAQLRDAGWHLSWVGSSSERARKLASFSHPEARDWLDPERVWATGEGWMRPLQPVDVDGSWPRWVRDGHAPEWWYRPR